ncbi:Electron transport complex protein RnfA, partial [Haemophilus influenzae]
FLPRFVNV